MTALGRPTPSLSRTMKDREWHPDPVPSYDVLPEPIAERLEKFPPTERAEEAVKLAHALSDGSSPSVQGDQRRLAGLINSSTDHWVSDRLMMEACTAPTPAMADTLRQLYVQAPPEYQQSIAGLAAITQLDPEGPGAADAKIVQTLLGTLPESRKLQQQVGQAGKRATQTNLGALQDQEWSRGTQNRSPQPRQTAPPRSRRTQHPMDRNTPPRYKAPGTGSCFY